MPRASPKYSHSSNGGAERAVQTTLGLMRCLKFSVEERLGIKIHPENPVLGWMCRRGAWLDTRFQLKKDNKTALES